MSCFLVPKLLLGNGLSRSSEVENFFARNKPVGIRLAGKLAGFLLCRFGGVIDASGSRSLVWVADWVYEEKLGDSRKIRIRL
jgi:hypothetical protein